MAMTRPSGDRSRNRLLTSLPPEQFEALSRHMIRVELQVPEILYEPGRPIRYAYFPESGMVSVVSLMENGDSIEIGTIGREGMVGSVLLLATETVHYRYFMQVNSQAMRIDADRLVEEAGRYPELRRMILRYGNAFLTQTMQGVACNGLHNVHQRCCRWLLMARDRSDSDELTLTHEFLALMLGVRRASVTDVLGPLQAVGLVTSVRGRITILNREGLEAGSCECYRLFINHLDYMLE